ncbi:TPA: PerC family transcriptional regulator [Klebsiella variicola subsp. variicola]|nr:PerC family transcriptional regulator [Klebsiella variicola subsp. variicola]
MTTKAKELEDKGLYRRAATRWGELMAKTYDDSEREWFKRKKDECIEKAKRPPVQTENFGGLSQAATETQNRMGIAWARGDAFRLPEYKKERRRG